MNGEGEEKGLDAADSEHLVIHNTSTVEESGLRHLDPLSEHSPVFFWQRDQSEWVAQLAQEWIDGWS